MLGIQTLRRRRRIAQNRRDRNHNHYTIDSLAKMLPLDEKLDVFYKGPTPLFLDFASVMRTDLDISEDSIRGSVAGLARHELKRLLLGEDAPLYQRIYAGNMLGLRSENIWQLHKNYDEIAPKLKKRWFYQPKVEEAVKGSDDGILSPDQIRRRVSWNNVRDSFHDVYPGEAYWFGYSLKLYLDEVDNYYLHFNGWRGKDEQHFRFDRDIVHVDFRFGNELRIDAEAVYSKLSELMLNMPGGISTKMLRKQAEAA